MTLRLFVFIAIPACVLFAQDSAKVTDKDIAQWITDLGSDKLDKRDLASRKLRETGRRAKAALEAAKPEDPEVKSRIASLLRILEVRQFRVLGGYDFDGRFTLWKADGESSMTVGPPHEHHGNNAMQAWSPDSKRVACLISGTLALLDVEGGGESVLVTSDQVSVPIWSPDSKAVAFQNDDLFVARAPEWKVESMKLKAVPLVWLSKGLFVGKDRKIIALDDQFKEGAVVAEHHSHAAADPRGKGFYFLGKADGQRGIAQQTHPLQHLDLATGTVSTIASGIARDHWSSLPAVSPDGTWIAFFRASKKPYIADLYIVRTDGRDERLVDEGRHASWSPDSRRLAYQPSGGGTTIYEVATSTSTHLEGIQRGSWSPVPPEE